MPLWKQILMNLYYYGTYPVRRGIYRRALAAGRMPVVIVFYHRIADDRANPWTTSFRMFARQIGWLRSRFELISLEEAQRIIRSGVNRRPCVSITFDDGYAENCREAIPLLIRQQIPCTYFVTLQNALDGQPYAHDLANGDCFAPNTLEQLRAMAAAGIEIGAHTYTHANLAHGADRRRLEYELVTAGKDLQDALGRPVRYFAFPYGQRADLSREAFALARQAGYDAVCSAYGGFNAPGDDPFHLQRIALGNTMISMKNRVTFDPRKLHTPRYLYQEPAKKQTTSDDCGPSLPCCHAERD